MRPQDYSHARQGVHPHIYRSTVEYLDGLQGVAAINTARHTRSRVPKPTMITLPLRLYLSPSKKFITVTQYVYPPTPNAVQAHKNRRYVVRILGNHIPR